MNESAKRRLIEMAYAHPTKAVANYKALVELAQRIAEADSVMLKLDADSVEQAVKNIFGAV